LFCSFLSKCASRGRTCHSSLVRKRSTKNLNQSIKGCFTPVRTHERLAPASQPVLRREGRTPATGQDPRRTRPRVEGKDCTTLAKVARPEAKRKGRPEAGQQQRKPHGRPVWRECTRGVEGPLPRQGRRVRGVQGPQTGAPGTCGGGKGRFWSSDTLCRVEDLPGTPRPTLQQRRMNTPSSTFPPKGRF